MRRALWLAVAIVCCTSLDSCGGGSSGSNTCTITAVVTPSSATADHSLPAPGNQVQFSAASTVTGNCPLIADQIGSWATSDPANTTVSNQAPTQGLAACLNATGSAVTISYSGTVRGHPFTPATLTCK